MQVRLRDGLKIGSWFGEQDSTRPLQSVCPFWTVSSGVDRFGPFWTVLGFFFRGSPFVVVGPAVDAVAWGGYTFRVSFVGTKLKDSSEAY